MSDAPTSDAASTAEVERVLRDLVRPLLERDSGGIELVAVRGSEVTVRLIAGCAGCPGATYTTDAVLLPLLRTVLPNVSLKFERTG